MSAAWVARERPPAARPSVALRGVVACRERPRGAESHHAAMVRELHALHAIGSPVGQPCKRINSPRPPAPKQAGAGGPLHELPTRRRAGSLDGVWR